MVEQIKGRPIENLNVVNRDLDLRPGTGKSLDQDFVRTRGGNLEVDLLKSSGRNFMQAGKDAANAATAAVNAAVGIFPEAPAALIAGGIMSAPDAFWGAWDACSTGAQKFHLLDKIYAEECEKAGIMGSKKADIDATWNAAKRHGDAMLSGPQWEALRDASMRVGKGALIAGRDSGAAVKNFGDGVAEGAAGLGVGGLKGIPFVVGKGVGLTLEYVGAGLEKFFGGMSAAGNYIEEKSNRIYFDAQPIEERAKF